MHQELGPEKIAEIVKLRNGGEKFADIAKQMGVAHSTVTKHYYANRTKKMKKEHESVHYLTPEETNKVINLTREGLSARQVAEKTGLSVYNIYQARKRGNVDSTAAHNRYRGAGTVKRAAILKRDKKILELQAKGWSAREIAQKLGTHKSTVYYSLNHGPYSHKGEMNGNNSSSSPGPDTHSEASTSELIGIAFAETNRVITNLSERIKIPADKLRRRLSELLAGPALR